MLTLEPSWVFERSFPNMQAQTRTIAYLLPGRVHLCNVLKQQCHPRPNFVIVQGCIELLERSGIPIAGKRAVVVGRSNIVGLPAALLLQNRDATVTMVHSRTPDAQKIAAGERSRLQPANFF